MKVSFSLKTISILSIFLTTLFFSGLDGAIAPSNHPILPRKISQKQLCQTAAQITVKVLSGKAWGSGILLQKQGNIYTVVTNGHVLKDKAEKFLIKTPDSQQYQASLLVNFNHGQATGHFSYQLSVISYQLTVPQI